MKSSQINRGLPRRVMYIENKEGLIDGAPARIGWVDFSRTGRSVYYRGRVLLATGGRGILGNFMDEETREEYWISGLKQRGSNAHHASSGLRPVVDEDARAEYQRIRRR